MYPHLHGALSFRTSCLHLTLHCPSPLVRVHTSSFMGKMCPCRWITSLKLQDPTHRRKKQHHGLWSGQHSPCAPSSVLVSNKLPTLTAIVWTSTSARGTRSSSHLAISHWKAPGSWHRGGWGHSRCSRRLGLWPTDWSFLFDGPLSTRPST